jgi:hypothetical protein
MKTGTSGKPQASSSYAPSPVRWGPVTVPQVIRSEPPGTPDGGGQASRHRPRGVPSGHAGAHGSGGG